jgi:hypothetical protein
MGSCGSPLLSDYHHMFLALPYRQSLFLITHLTFNVVLHLTRQREFRPCVAAILKIRWCLSVDTSVSEWKPSSPNL